MNNYLDIVKSRFSCKQYSSKAVSKEDINYILEAGRMSPSSFGLETWNFHVVQSNQKHNALRKILSGQESVQSSNFTIIITGPISDLEPSSNFIKTRGERFPSSIEDYIEDFRPYYEYLSANNLLVPWVKSQGYIAITNMMNAACEKGILSCCIEGFDNNEILDFLGLDNNKQVVSIIATFGYPKEEMRDKIRMPLAEITKYY